MSFANINIGTTGGDHSGDNLRVAFNKVNQNFQKIASGNVAINVTAPVTSVAGRTGNVVLTANDVIGAVTQGQVEGLVIAYVNDVPVSNFNNDANYANESYVDTAVSNLRDGAPVNLDTLYKIANSLGNNASLSESLTGAITGANVQISALWANAASQSNSLANLASGLNAANVVIAEHTNSINTLISNAASQAGALATLTANAAGQSDSLAILTANAATQSGDLTTLFANAASQASTLTGLLANAVTQQTSLESLTANAATQNDSLITLTANAASQADTLVVLIANAAAQTSELIGANAAIVTANTAMKSYVDAQDSAVTTAWQANAAAQYDAIISANTALKTYTDDRFTSLIGGAPAVLDTLNEIALSLGNNASLSTTLLNAISGSNAAIVTANTAMKSYVDAQDSAITAAWQANAAVQEGLISTLQGQVYTNSNVANYLPSHTGNISANTINANKGAVGNNTTISSSNTHFVVNPSSLPPMPSNGTLQVTNLAGVSPQILVDSADDTFAGSFFARRARGNAIAPTATLVGDVLGSFYAKGYTTSGWTATRSSGLTIYATENATATAQGSNVVVMVTPTNSNSSILHTKFEPNGAVIINTGVSSTAFNNGALQVLGGAGVSGNVNASGGIRAGTGVFADRYHWANSVPIQMGYGNTDVQSYLNSGNIALGGTQTDTYLWSNGAPVVFGSTYGNANVSAYLENSSVSIATIKTDNYQWANSEPINFALLNANGSITIGSVEALFSNAISMYSGTVTASTVVSTTAVSGNINVSGTITAATGNLTTINGSTINAGTGNLTTINAGIVNSVTAEISDSINVGNLHIGNRILGATGGNTDPLSIDFPNVSVEHTLTVKDDLVIDGNINSINHSTGALVVTNGGMGVSGNVFVAGHPDSRFQVGEGGAFFPNVIAQFTGNIDSYLQINMQNLNSGPNASSDLVATADIGTDDQYYVNLGINNSTFADPDYPAFAPLDSYLVADGGNLLLIAEREGKTITFMQGGYHTANIVGQWNDTVLSVNTDLSVTSDISSGGNISGLVFNGNVVGTNGTITNIDSYTGYFASNLATSWMAFGSDPLNRNAGLLGQVVDSLGFTTQYGNGVILVNEQGSVEQNLFLGDTGITSNATLLGVSVTQSGSYFNVLNLTGTGNLHVPSVHSTLYGNVQFTPANVSNWNSSVTTIAEALDELALRLRTAGF